MLTIRKVSFSVVNIATKEIDMYIAQLHAGHFYVCAYTNARAEDRRAAFYAPSFDTRAEAEVWVKENRPVFA